MVEQGQQTAGPRPRADKRLPPHIQIPPDAQGQQDIDADDYSPIPAPNIPPGYAADLSEPQAGPSSSSQPTSSGQAAKGKGVKRKSATETASDKSGKRQKKK